ncbi:hypothetical protein R0I01_17845 [Bacillus pumilus]|nr:hypothetical protein R0I01_17845 [Bacillus pumilus]
MILVRQNVQGNRGTFVRMMNDPTVKGLEFQVRLYCRTRQNFNMMDLNQSYLLDKELGFGASISIPELRNLVLDITPLWDEKKKMRKELLSERAEGPYCGPSKG